MKLHIAYLPVLVFSVIQTGLGTLEGQEKIDHIRDLQNAAIEAKSVDWGHWGVDPGNYTQWGTHSSRLIPVYTFGTKDAGANIDLRDYTGKNSLFREPEHIETVFGHIPVATFNPDAVYCDQTDIGRIQRSALEAGKKHIFLIVFDGMDWQTTRAAAIVKNQKVDYEKGRGHGLFFQDYQAEGTSQYGYMVTVPKIGSVKTNTKKQTAVPGEMPDWGGYDARLGGAAPWEAPLDIQYLIGKSSVLKQPYPDSAGTATSMTTGIKTYNGAIGVGVEGNQLRLIAHLAQDMGYKVGAVSSVPISHATPAAAYAHNVSRNDYHEIARDLIGLPSVSHPDSPLVGLDVVLGGGVGEMPDRIEGSAIESFLGSKYIAAEDLKAVSKENGGPYQVVVRSPGVDGKPALEQAVKQALENDDRLLGVFGVEEYSGHLPFQTADGNYNPAKGRKSEAEKYTAEEVRENPTLADMTAAALEVLSQKESKFWLMVEAGDVDWANHDNNLDNSIGAVYSGDDAFRVVVKWVEANSNWEESLVILTADHGHYLFLNDPSALIKGK